MKQKPSVLPIPIISASDLEVDSRAGPQFFEQQTSLRERQQLCWWTVDPAAEVGNSGNSGND